MNIEILENGNLKLTLAEDDRDEIEYNRSREFDDVNVLLELTEHYWTMGAYEPFDADNGNPFVGLTSAPCIAEEMEYDEDGAKQIIGRFWYYSDYMIKSFIDELVETGEVIFTLASD